jgi:hypothetical protein
LKNRESVVDGIQPPTKVPASRPKHLPTSSRSHPLSCYEPVRKECLDDDLVWRPRSPLQLTLRPHPCLAVNIGVAGVSFKMRKRRETGKDSAKREQRRRAARLHQSYPSSAFRGYSREALRQPHMSPEADHWQRSLRLSILKDTPTAPRKAIEAILRP